MSTPMETIINESPVTGSMLSLSDVETLADSGFYWREKKGVKVLVCRPLSEAGFTNGFSTRLGGVSPFPAGDLNLTGCDEDSSENIYENRQRFLKVFDGDFVLSTVWQVHGDAIRLIKTKDEAHDTDQKFDGIVANIPNLLVGVKTADCVPILLADPKTGAFSAVHA